MKEILDKTLLILEDDIQLLGNYEKVAKHYFSKIKLCSSINETEILMKTHKVDAMLLDYYLPDGESLCLFDSFDLTKNKIPIVLITAHSDKDMAIKALNQGICHLIEKPIDKNILITAFQKITQIIIEEDLLSHITNKYKISIETESILKEKHQITTRELEIIYLALAKETNINIGKKLFISPKTVKTHFQNIFTKLALSSREEIANFIYSLNQKQNKSVY